MSEESSKVIYATPRAIATLVWGGHLNKIQYIARACTGTQYKMSDPLDFCKKLILRGHMSPFEHVRITIPSWDERNLRTDFLKKEGAKLPYGYNDRTTHINVNAVNINVRDFLAIGGPLEDVDNYEGAEDYLTAEFNTSIAISRELLRHRIFSFMEKSTRYCKFDDELVVMNPLEAVDNDSIYDKYSGCYDTAAADAHKHYKAMRDIGANPGDARAVLPLCTHTVLYMTGRLDDWYDMFKLRLAPGAHPEMRALIKRFIRAEWAYFDKDKLESIIKEA